MAESWASSDHARRSMQGNRSRDTAPELAVRKLVHGMGLRYRVNARPLPTLRRTADLVFSRRRVAVFIDGCFWHGCPEHHRPPSANSDYWAAKVARNRARDAATDETLVAAGWTVLRFWAHQPPDEVAEEVRIAVRGAGGAMSPMPTSSKSIKTGQGQAWPLEDIGHQRWKFP